MSCEVIVLSGKDNMPPLKNAIKSIIVHYRIYT